MCVVQGGHVWVQMEDPRGTVKAPWWKGMPFHVYAYWGLAGVCVAYLGVQTVRMPAIVQSRGVHINSHHRSCWRPRSRPKWS